MPKLFNVPGSRVRYARRLTRSNVSHLIAWLRCERIQATLEGRLMSKAKEELTKFIEEQPEDSSREEIIRELAFHVMVERGLADSDAGRVISNDEMARRIRSWPK